MNAIQEQIGYSLTNKKKPVRYAIIDYDTISMNSCQVTSILMILALYANLTARSSVASGEILVEVLTSITHLLTVAKSTHFVPYFSEKIKPANFSAYS